MLKPEGDILLTFLASNPIYDVYRNMAKHKKWKQYSKTDLIAPYHGSDEPEKQLRKILLDAGFDVLVCHVEKRTYMFPNMDIWRSKSIMFSVDNGTTLLQISDTIFDVFVGDEQVIISLSSSREESCA